LLEPEDHDAQADADLRRREAGACRSDHRLAHVGEQRVELRRAEALDLGRADEQPRIAHAKNVADHGTQSPRTTCSSSATDFVHRSLQHVGDARHRNRACAAPVPRLVDDDRDRA
jgi:hypothetical protein